MTFKREGVAYSDDGAMLVQIASGSTIANPTFTTTANFPDGSAAVPAIAWTSDADGSGTGFYRHSANSTGVAANGVAVWRWASTGIFTPVTDAGSDIGTTTLRVRNVFLQAVACAVRSLSTGTTLTTADSVILTTTAGGAVTHTLPAANAVGAGNTQRITVRKTNASANALTVQRGGSDTVDGGTSVTVADNSSRDFVSDGVSAWWSV